MERDTSDKDYQAKKLAQIFCSSFYRSKYANEELSVKELSSDLYKILGKYDGLLEDSLAEFDGYSSRLTISDEFQKRRSIIRRKLKEQAKEVLNLIPSPIRDESENVEKPYQYDENFKSRIENGIVEKWFKKYVDMGGSSSDRVECYKFDEKELRKVVTKLKETGRYKIMDDAMQEVIDIAALKGKYKFFKEFETVPEACRHFEEELGDDVTVKAIKKEIKARVQIIKEGEQKEWKNVNKGINAWVHSENNKPSRGQIIPKE